MAVLEGRDAPATALLRAVAAATGAHGVRWVGPEQEPMGAVGSGWSERDAAELRLPGGVERLDLFGCREADLARIDLDQLGRLLAATRSVAEDRRREAALRDAVERAEARQRAAVETLERHRRGATAAILGGHFPTVAGRSPAIRDALDRLATLAQTSLPVLIEGPPGSGRRHLARAFHVLLGGEPEGCAILDVAMVPPELMKATLLRLEAEAAGGCFIIANAEHLTPDVGSWLIARAESDALRGRPVLTLARAEQGPLVDVLRRALAPGRVAVPGLDERLEDLPQLIDTLAQTVGKRPEQIGTGARAILARRAWPGHVAELRDLLARAAVRANGGVMLPEHLEAATAEALTTSLSEGLELGYHDAVRSFRRELLRHALATTGGNRTHAAELLGVQRTYFMRLIRELGADDIRPGQSA